MSICRACSSEITGPDRYCRNCGVAVAPVVAEFDDTRRFNPSAPLPPVPPGAPDTTNPLYAPQYASYAAPQASAPLRYHESLIKKLLKQKIVWAMMMFALLIICFSVGVGIGSNINRRGGDFTREFGDEHDAENPEAVREKYEESVQNALGFKQGEYSATEFPDAQGIFVNNLMSDDSPAALAKIQAGDLITELNGKQTRNDSELSEVLKTLETGHEVPVTVYRDGATIGLKIKISDRAFPPAQPKIDPDDQGFLGILDSSRHCCISGTKKWGVKVTELHTNGPAELFGLRDGDVITEFNGRPVKTPNEFNRHIRAAKPGSKVSLTFYRGGAEQKVEVILGHRWE